MAHISYLGGWGGRLTWTQQFKAIWAHLNNNYQKRSSFSVLLLLLLLYLLLFQFFETRFLCVALASWNSLSRPSWSQTQTSTYPCLLSTRSKVWASKIFVFKVEMGLTLFQYMHILCMGLRERQAFRKKRHAPEQRLLRLLRKALTKRFQPKNANQL